MQKASKSNYRHWPNLEATMKRCLEEDGHKPSEFYNMHLMDNKFACREVKCLCCGQTWSYNDRMLSYGRNPCQGGV